MNHANIILGQSLAVRDVLVERRRQVEKEGWSPEHDDRHNECQLAAAASCYALGTTDIHCKGARVWPWSPGWWKPEGGYRRMLVKAGALIIAEIERMDRAEAKAEARIEIIGQNGNDGAVYSELDRLQGAACVNRCPTEVAREARERLTQDLERRQKVHLRPHQLAEVDRLKIAEDFNNDIPAGAQPVKEPQRPRHLCSACGQGHALHNCTGGLPPIEDQGWSRRGEIEPQPGKRYDVRFDDGYVAECMSADYANRTNWVMIRESRA